MTPDPDLTDWPALRVGEVPGFAQASVDAAIASTSPDHPDSAKLNPAPHAHTAEESKPPRYIVATDGQEATVFDLTRGKDLFPTTTSNRRYALTAGGCTHETATLIADALNYDQHKAFDLLRRALSEIDNLQRKIAANEQEGWEGSRRRSILKHELAAALTQATAKP